MLDFEALHEAIQSGKIGKLKALLTSSNIHDVDEIGWTPLFYGVASGDDRVVQIALDLGADPQRQDRSGWSALQLARMEGKTKLETLMKRRFGEFEDANKGLSL